jgi:hypothetical protein
MSKIIKRLFTPFVAFALSIGVSASLSGTKGQIPVDVKAATHSVTITRENFPAGSLAYGTNDPWTATGTDGTVLNGEFDLYSQTNQTNMQSRTKTPIGDYFHNISPFPGAITEIEMVKTSDTGSIRKWTPYLSTSTVLKASNATTAGTPLTAQDVATTTTWPVSASENYRFVYLQLSGGATNIDSIKITYEVSDEEFGNLVGINVSADNAKTSFLTGETFTSAGLVVEAYDDSTPALTKFVSDYTTNFDGVTFESSHVGTKVVTVTYQEKTATYTIEIAEPVLLNKVTTETQLQFGATYAIGAAANEVAMKTEVSNFFSKYDATFVSGSLVESTETQLFTLEIGAVANSFAFKLINGPKVNEYINAPLASSNYMNTTAELNANSSWTITFNGSTMRVTNVALSDRYIQYNSDSPRFSTYKNPQKEIEFYFKAETISDEVAVRRLVDEINTGRGNAAAGSCATYLAVFEGAYNQLTTAGKQLFDTSTDADFVAARERMAYLQAWVAAHPEAQGLNLVLTQNSITVTVAIGVVVGLTLILGYYLYKRKKRA